MSSDNRVARSPGGNLRTLGAFWIVYGIARVIMAICLFIFSGTATLMFGALLNRVPNPYALMADFHFFYVVTIALSILCGILGIAGGLALIAGSGSGRILVLAAAFFSLCEIPLGLTLGIYTLIVLLPIRTVQQV